MPDNSIKAQFDFIKSAVNTTAKDSLFKFDEKNSRMLITNKNVTMKAAIELQLKNISAELGIKVEPNHTTGTLKFNIKL